MKNVFLIIFICAVAVNGSTDAVCSICGVVSSGAMRYRWASLLAAVMNFLGLSFFAFLFPSLTETMGTFGGGSTEEGIAVLLAVVIWASFAWCVSVPTSESHGLIAATAGVFLAKTGRLQWNAIVISIFGAITSAVFGALFAGVVSSWLKNKKIRGRAGVIAGCAASAFFHGAQDGQKFLSVGIAYSLVEKNVASVFFVALIMFCGTLIGGRRIVSAVGEKMARLDYSSAISSDLGCALSLLVLTLMGVPVSTTHTKTCAIAGSAAMSGDKIDIKELALIIMGWILTIPSCILLAFSITKTGFLGYIC